jgi:bifunctional DNA-binding transcriptional regulator/antitoxin component of YhaV-PrlF toxin-antitoxin module
LTALCFFVTIIKEQIFLAILIPYKGVSVLLPKQAKETDSVLRKRISVSQKRQITIPIEFYNKLEIKDEVDCFVQNNQLIIRPAQDRGEFDEQILSDLISQGFTGEKLLAKFKEARRNVRPAIESLLSEAQLVAEGKGEYFILSDLVEDDI